MSKRSNRFRVNSMSNEELANFIFSDELEYMIRKYGGGPQSIIRWLKESSDGTYPYVLNNLTIKEGNINATITNFIYGDIEVGDILETYSIDERSYRLKVNKIIYPMYIGDKYYAEAKFEDEGNIPIKVLPELLYKGCKVVEKNVERRVIEINFV